MESEDENQPGHEGGQQSAAAFKAFMMKHSANSNTNLYDHLTRLLVKVMDERPENVVDVFEDMSLDVKRGVSEQQQSSLRDSQHPTAAEQLAEQQRLLFVQPEENDMEEELVDTPYPNMNEIGFFLEQAGMGLGREEMHRLFLAFKQLAETQSLQHCRFWGKILGTQNSYIIAEAEYREGEEEEDRKTEAAEQEQKNAEIQENDEGPGPVSTFKPTPVVPKEPIGTGANKFAYYVCNEPGLPWSKLPPVTPAQITAARQIRKFFTGRLDNTFASYPPFPGNEANYLRAQIARISAGTQVSPLGFFQAVDEEEANEEEEAPRDSYEANPDFEGIPVAEMTESLSTWVHHVQHILQQGRCTWVNLNAKSDDEFPEEEEAKEGDEEPEEPEPEPEDGPPLLTPLSYDAEIFQTPPWSCKASSTLTSRYAVAVLRSNVWPGACAYACGKKFENIYIGWGLKYGGGGYSPPVPPPPQKEYPDGPEISEDMDPSLEEELALQEAIEIQQAAQEELEESDENEEGDED